MPLADGGMASNSGPSTRVRSLGTSAAAERRGRHNEPAPAVDRPAAETRRRNSRRFIGALILSCYAALMGRALSIVMALCLGALPLAMARQASPQEQPPQTACGVCHALPPADV